MHVSKELEIEKLEALAQEPGFIYSFAIVLCRDMFLDVRQAADINWRDRVSFQEASFVAGLMIKKPLRPLEVRAKEEHDEQIGRLYEGLRALQHAYNQPMMDQLHRTIERAEREKSETPPSHQEVFSQGALMPEPIFYGGSGAYDFQYLELAVERYEADAPWLLGARGVVMPELVAIYEFLREFETDKHHALGSAKGFDEFCAAALGVFTFTISDLQRFDNRSVDALIQNFSSAPGGVNAGLDDVGGYNAVNSHPLICLPDGGFLLPIPFLLAQSLYESPFYWMWADPAYRASASANRGSSTEAIAERMLTAVFGPGAVYTNVDVMRSRTERLSEIDVLVVKGNRAIIVQAKSKKLTELARRGSDEHLQADFGAAVQSAYEQGLICRRAVLDGSKHEMFTKAGEKIRIKEKLSDAYIICLSSDHYPAIVHQLDILLKKGSDDPYPIAVSVFDLELLAAYLTDPFEFVYYLRQRIALTEYYRANSEAAYLGWHLRQKLFRTHEADMVWIDEQFAQLIDANYPALRGMHPKTEAMNRVYTKWRNPDFSSLLEAVKKNASPNFTDAIFLLYDLAGDGADTFVRNMKMVKAKAKSDGKGHDFTALPDGGATGISFLVFPTADSIHAHLLAFCEARKHKAQARSWLGFASYIGSPLPVDSAVYSDFAWEYDAELDELAATMLKKGQAVNARGEKIGRNEPCICGSGKKYKKCCGKG